MFSCNEKPPLLINGGIFQIEILYAYSATFCLFHKTRRPISTRAFACMPSFTALHLPHPNCACSSSVFIKIQLSLFDFFVAFIFFYPFSSYSSASAICCIISFEIFKNFCFFPLLSVDIRA